MAHEQVNEIFDRVSAIEDMDLKISTMEKICKEQPYILKILEMAVNPKLKIDRIPVGCPKNFRPESDLPVGISDTNIRTEFRRIQNYITGGVLSVLTAQRLEESWVALLQGVHYQEAEILTMVKDQTLLEKYPDFWVILPALGVDTSINTNEGNTPKKQTKPKKIKK